MIIKPDSRRDSLALGLSSMGALSMPTNATASAGVASNTAVYEHTFLKAKRGLRADLGKYARANWFPMDQLALEQGIFTSYWLLEEAGDNAMWDYVMVVGYATTPCYHDPETTKKFIAIRKAHTDVKIDGRSMGELGDFAGNHRLKIV
jgi:hypothetical protein